MAGLPSLRSEDAEIDSPSAARVRDEMKPDEMVGVAAGSQTDRLLLRSRTGIATYAFTFIHASFDLQNYSFGNRFTLI